MAFFAWQFVFIKAWSSTNDPKKAVVDAADSDRNDTGTTTSESTQGIADGLIANDGSTQEQIDPFDSHMQKNIAQNIELAKEEQLAKSRRIGNYDNSRLPSSINTQKSIP